MGEKIVIGPFAKGLRTDVTPFVIDDDSFPVLINAYQWRGRIKRKRGTGFLCRLTRLFNSTIISYSASSTIALVGGAANVLTGFGLQANGSLIPGSVDITDTTGPQLYVDTFSNGALIGSLGGSGTINYATGDLTIVGGGAHTVSANFFYSPGLPVLGLEDLLSTSNNFPGTMAFDTTYSYVIQTVNPWNSYDVSFYKNPSTASFINYVAKTNYTATSWNGQDYQQFWTVNYQGALWATNGVNEPFSTANIGMQFKNIAGINAIVAGPPATANLNIIGHGLVIGDFVFINEVVGVTGINFQTGYVTAVTDVNNVTVTFQNAVLGGAYSSGGIAQYLTSRSSTTLDCLRFYDGDPTNGSATNPMLTGFNGWVNFMPPLSQANYVISELPLAQYYLVGARMIQAFKDRLLFIGPVVQSSGGSPIYLQDTVIFSQNGTPYYTASFNGQGVNALITGTYIPILTPSNESAAPNAYFADQNGFGGFIQAGVQQPAITSSTNQDVLMIGFRTLQTKLVFSGNDLLPFNFYSVNSELGSGSTFSAVNMDRGIISRGSRGFIIANQDQAIRIDLEIPDQVYQINLLNNGTERITAARDFINEWIYFSYPSNMVNGAYKFNSQTLQYNYRDDSWAIFNECYTTYGSFRPQTGYTWATIGTQFGTWGQWNKPWNAGSTTLLQSIVIAGNQQGYVVMRDQGTGESPSLYVQAFSSNTVTVPNHTLNEGDYIIFQGCIGTVSTQVNNQVFSVATIVDANNFTLSPGITAGTYVGGGQINRYYVPFVQTKQFPTSWQMGRKTRLGVQQYLLSKTSTSQITLLIYLSQNSASAYNDGAIMPANNTLNNSLIYSTVLYTCPESTNLGLTPANINLNTPTAGQQAQIWHRINTSLIGDTVQLGFTMSDAQMRDVNLLNQTAEIELHGIIIDVTPSQMLV